MRASANQIPDAPHDQDREDQAEANPRHARRGRVRLCAAMTPEKYRDRIFRAAVHFVERNRPNHADDLAGDLDFLAEVDRILDDMMKTPSHAKKGAT